MSRPSTITDDQILSAARAVFLEKGIRAKSAEVARRAGCAEGSIFNRFKTKADLFRAAMLQPHLEEPAWIKTLVERVGQGEVRDNLTDVGVQVIEFFRGLLPLMMMSWSNPEQPAAATGKKKAKGHPFLHPAMQVPNPPPLRALKKMAGFFEAEIRAGRIRRHDPEVMARAFIGALQNFVFFELLTQAQDELPLPAEGFVRGLVNFLWVGAEPLSPTPPTTETATAIRRRRGP